MKTRAERDGDDWILNGVKTWITNAGESEYYTVMAVTDPDGARGRNISAFVVEKSDEGFTFGEKERKLGIKGSPTRELLFDNVRLPGDRIVGEPGEGLKIALRTLDHTRVTIAAQAVGVAQGALDYALAYVKDRQQFGKSIADNQAIQFMLADMGMKLEAARQLTYTAAAKSERGDEDLTYFGAAAGLRLRCRNGDHHGRRAAARRSGLRRRPPGRADDARCEDHADLRGYQSDPAHGDGTQAPRLSRVRTLCGRPHLVKAARCRPVCIERAPRIPRRESAAPVLLSVKNRTRDESDMRGADVPESMVLTRHNR